MYVWCPTAQSGGGDKGKNFVKDMVAGAIAGCLEVTIMYPTEYIKTQLQLPGKKYSGMFDCAVRRLWQRPRCAVSRL